MNKEIPLNEYLEGFMKRKPHELSQKMLYDKLNELELVNFSFNMLLGMELVIYLKPAEQFNRVFGESLVSNLKKAKHDQ